MKTKSLLVGAAAALALAAIGASSAVAGAVPYPNSGTPNPVTYVFTATSTGDVKAYFAGSGASYDEQVGLLVNGVQQGPIGLDDHSSTVGDVLDFGNVTAGDTLVFFDDILSTGDVWYSDPSLNGGNGNHVYSTSAAAGQVYAGSPAGTYVGFEDLRFPDSDYNYYDDTFVFTNTTSSVPEPITWAMMLGGFGLLGAVLRSSVRTNRELESLRSSAL